MQVSREQHEHYWENGWVVVDDVFPPGDIERVCALLMADAADELQAGTSEALVDIDADGTRYLRKLEGLFPRRPEYRELVLSPRLTAIVGALLGDVPLVLGDMLFLKPPRCGSIKRHHQDNFHLCCEPADRVLTAWIALDDADEDNGCLHYVDGSHRGPVLPHAAHPECDRDWTPAPELLAGRPESAARVRRGGVVLHHSKTLHVSYPNRSDRWRRGHCSNWVTPAVTSTKSKIRRAYFNQPEYAHLFAARDAAEPSP